MPLDGFEETVLERESAHAGATQKPGRCPCGKRCEWEPQEIRQGGSRITNWPHRGVDREYITLVAPRSAGPGNTARETQLSEGAKLSRFGESFANPFRNRNTHCIANEFPSMTSAYAVTI
jgi:hypothetical protein